MEKQKPQSINDEKWVSFWLDFMGGGNKESRKLFIKSLEKIFPTKAGWEHKINEVNNELRVIISKTKISPAEFNFYMTDLDPIMKDFLIKIREGKDFDLLSPNEKSSIDLALKGLYSTGCDLDKNKEGEITIRFGYNRLLFASCKLKDYLKFYIKNPYLAKYIFKTDIQFIYQRWSPIYEQQSKNAKSASKDDIEFLDIMKRGLKQIKEVCNTLNTKQKNNRLLSDKKWISFWLGIQPKDQGPESEKWLRANFPEDWKMSKDPDPNFPHTFRIGKKNISPRQCWEELELLDFYPLKSFIKKTVEDTNRDLPQLVPPDKIASALEWLSSISIINDINKQGGISIRIVGNSLLIISGDLDKILVLYKQEPDFAKQLFFSIDPQIWYENIIKQYQNGDHSEKTIKILKIFERSGVIKIKEHKKDLANKIIPSKNNIIEDNWISLWLTLNLNNEEQEKYKQLFPNKDGWQYSIDPEYHKYFAIGKYNLRPKEFENEYNKLKPFIESIKNHTLRSLEREMLLPYARFSPGETPIVLNYGEFEVSGKKCQFSACFSSNQEMNEVLARYNEAANKLLFTRTETRLDKKGNINAFFCYFGFLYVSCDLVKLLRFYKEYPEKAKQIFLIDPQIWYEQRLKKYWDGDTSKEVVESLKIFEDSGVIKIKKKPWWKVWKS
jgi:hypothetical protein